MDLSRLRQAYRRALVAYVAVEQEIDELLCANPPHDVGELDRLIDTRNSRRAAYEAAERAYRDALRPPHAQ